MKSAPSKKVNCHKIDSSELLRIIQLQSLTKHIWRLGGCRVWIVTRKYEDATRHKAFSNSAFSVKKKINIKSK